MKHTRAAPLVLVLILATAAYAENNPLDQFTRAWRDDPVWHDGRAEIADYDATRTIYGQPRAYVARVMINKELASPQTFTKSADSTGREVFKLHVRDDIPTEAYTYHYATMVYVGTDDLKSVKLDMGSQEDCGASMKRIVNHDGELKWSQYSYFPQQGYRDGSFTPPDGLVLMDALPVVLRGYPFDAPRDLALKVVPEQTTTRWSPMRVEDYTVQYVGQETLDLPIGEVDAHHLRLRFAGPTRELRPPIDFWFAADPRMRHVMVRYDGPDGQGYRLKSLVRDAYWVR